MYLATLELVNFRNYPLEKLSFHRGINIFTGLNAQGKTNLLEAIYYLAVSRSFRTNQESDLLRFGSEYFSLKGTFQRKEESARVSMDYRLPRHLQIGWNGKLLKRTEYIYRQPVVVFSPDDLLLIKEGPSVRRRFLDTEGSRLKPLYYRRLRDYHRALQQRNRVLKESRGGSGASRMLLEPWDLALVKWGSIIIRERIRMLAALEKRARTHFATLTGAKETLSLCYLPTFEPGDEPDLIERSFMEQLGEAYPAEIRRGATLVGPHLDDFTVIINGHDARKYGSQGQQRSAVLALKIGEVDLFKKAGGEEPILLLDDVLSEFDEKRSKHLLHFLRHREGQSFITTALDRQAADRRWPDEARVYNIYRGKVKIDRAGTDY